MSAVHGNHAYIDIRHKTLAYVAQVARSDKNGDRFEDVYAKNLTISNKNGIFRGKNVTSEYESGKLYAMISDPDSDLMVGDYFITGIGGKDITCRIAGFNLYPSYQTEIPPHVVIVPDQCLMDSVAMNDTMSTEGGYYQSKMRTVHLPTIATSVQETFGEHLLCHPFPVYTSAVNSTKIAFGDSSSYGQAWSNTWEDEIPSINNYVDLMTELNVYGTIIWSSSYLDVAFGGPQFPLFFLSPEHIWIQKAYWLNGMVDVTSYAAVASGFASEYRATNKLGVRPRWLLRGA